MKRKTRSFGLKIRTYKTRKNFSKEQLEAIGAVAMAYNDAEYELNNCLGQALGVELSFWNDLATRINGSEGKKALILRAAQIVDWPDEVKASIADALIAFAEWKGYRDSIVHARLIDKARAIGSPIQRQGSQGEILLTASAIEAIYDRITIVIDELRLVDDLFGAYYADINKHGRYCPNGTSAVVFRDQRAKRLELAIQEYLAQAQAHQKARRSLPPLPLFPKGSQAVLEELRTLIPKTADDG